MSEAGLDDCKGTATSKDSNGEEATQLKTLTARHLDLITSSWAIVSEDLQGAGLIMFFKLFEIAPDLITLFPFKDDELSDKNDQLKKHAMQVMESINACLGMVGEPEKLQETLIELGIIHNMNSVKVNSFAPVGQALIYALQQACGVKFTAEVQEAWIILYGIVQHYMTVGMNEGLEA